MKLADSWTEEVRALAALNSFHDEAEEVDEVDEAKDGCGGVCVEKYVLNRAGTSNSQLHELAREVRGAEKRQGKRFNVTQYKAIFRKWESQSKPFLRARHDYFVEFLAKLDCVLVPKGETLQAAFERAKHREPPAKAAAISNKGVQLLASLCRELQERNGGQPIMLHQASVAKLFGHSDHRNISNWIRALKTLGVLDVAKRWSFGKSQRYFYVESPFT
jgi:hypothetical protein